MDAQKLLTSMIYVALLVCMQVSGIAPSDACGRYSVAMYAGRVC